MKAWYCFFVVVLVVRAAVGPTVKADRELGAILCWELAISESLVTGIGLEAIFE